MKELLGDRYQIIKKIGSGGMAIVYLAKDLSLDRYVAIKLLRDEYTEDSTFKRHFQKEAVAIAKLSHNNIVGIYDILSDGETMCLVMEYVEGETLKDQINRDGAIPWRKAVKYGIQIANALAYAHSNQIIHKDVKSQNIIINKNDNVKITDFGISQMMNNTTITHNKGVLGSAHYFSPEQARGEKLSYQTDIYSLGVVLYEMLVGELPFTADNPVSVALKHIQETPKPVNSLVSDIPEGLSQIVAKCLQKNPEDRFANMQAVANALSSIPLSKDGTAVLAAGAVTGAAAAAAAKSAAKAAPQKLAANRTKAAAAPKASAKKKQPPKKKKKTNFFVLFIIVLLVLGATMVLAQKIAPPSEMHVPDFRGMTLSDAESKAQSMGINITETGSEYSEEYDEGEIISQTPDAGTNISKDETVSVVLSKGSQQTTVPNVLGQTLDAATSSLKEADLQVGNVTKSYSASYAAGMVISQAIQADTKISRGSTVDLVISLGEEPYAIVPNLVGSDINSAKQMIEEAGLKVGSISYQSSDNDNNTVIEQSLAYGSKVDENSSIDLVVSSGPDEDDENNDGNSPSSEAKTQNVSITAPDSGYLSIILTDDRGEQTVNYRRVSKGEKVEGVYQYYGDATFEIKLDDKVIDTISAS
ncbi:MAG: Stk1 family PASTA domain-containing Ser/Thr kinase [Peptococcaceae bacterium]|nr:Stk1 family PASTA domain-containing Ser/Thr kinase [Peptococcaceae bacterium]